PGELLVGLVPVVDGASRDLRLLGGGADVRSARELLEEAFLACLSGVLAGALTCPSRPSVGHGPGPDRDDGRAVDRPVELAALGGRDDPACRDEGVGLRRVRPGEAGQRLEDQRGGGVGVGDALVRPAGGWEVLVAGVDEEEVDVDVAVRDERVAAASEAVFACGGADGVEVRGGGAVVSAVAVAFSALWSAWDDDAHRRLLRGDSCAPEGRCWVDGSRRCDGHESPVISSIVTVSAPPARG